MKGKGKIVDNNKMLNKHLEKLKWHLVPLSVLRPIVGVMSFGAGKHPENEWKNLSFDYHYDALMRHLDAHVSGERIDKESGELHLAHAGCRILFMIWLTQQEKK